MGGGWLKQCSSCILPTYLCQEMEKSSKATSRLIFSLHTGVALLIIFQLQAPKITQLSHTNTEQGR